MLFSLALHFFKFSSV